MVLGTTENRRKQIAVGERVPLELSERERDLIMKHTFAGNNLTDRLRLVPIPADDRLIALPWMIWMNWRATSLQKRTMRRSGNTSKSCADCTRG
jgi:hypothetical protein